MNGKVSQRCPFRLSAFALLCLCVAGAAFSQDIRVQDLSDSIEAGRIRIESAKGTGASTGAAIQCVLANATAETLYLDIFIRGGLYFMNGGSGQDMLAAAVFLADGSYNSWKDRFFIIIDPGKSVDAVMLAFCAEFEKDNPSGSDSFTTGKLPAELRTVLARIEDYLRKNPDTERIAAIQAAVWMAQGLTLEHIRQKFEVGAEDEKLARSFLK
jgi:hypothetical protein